MKTRGHLVAFALILQLSAQAKDAGEAPPSVPVPAATTTTDSQVSELVKALKSRDSAAQATIASNLLQQTEGLASAIDRVYDAVDARARFRLLDVVGRIPDEPPNPLLVRAAFEAPASSNSRMALNCLEARVRGGQAVSLSEAQIALALEELRAGGRRASCWAWILPLIPGVDRKALAEPLTSALCRKLSEHPDSVGWTLETPRDVWEKAGIVYSFRPAASADLVAALRGAASGRPPEEVRWRMIGRGFARDPEAAPEALALAGNKDVDAWVRAMALRAYAAVEPEKAVSVLKSYLSDGTVGRSWRPNVYPLRQAAEASLQELRVTGVIQSG